MAKSASFSMLAVQATLDGLKVVGLWDGDDAIVIAPGADSGVGVVGADGSSIFSGSPDRSATITLRLQHTSATHRQLLQKLAMQNSGRLVGFPFDVKDIGSGEGGTTDQAFVMRPPSDTKGKAAGPREWVLWAGNYERLITNP